MSEEKKAKAIVVVEVSGRERSYVAEDWGTTPEGKLTVTRDRPAVALYGPTAWLSVRDKDATGPDRTAVALDIAKKALDAITRVSDGNVAIKLALDALGEIFAETEL